MLIKKGGREAWSDYKKEGKYPLFARKKKREGLILSTRRRGEKDYKSTLFIKTQRGGMLALSRRLHAEGGGERGGKKRTTIRERPSSSY